MIIKTKKYQLSKDTFIKTGLKNILMEFWWVWFIPVLVLILGVVLGGPWWGLSIALLLSILWVLFWAIQFAGLSQAEQGKPLFEKYIYEIDSRQILMRLDEKRGIKFNWDQIKKASIEKDHFLMYLSKVQFIYLPFSIFRSENDLRFMESLLKRKQLVKEKSGVKTPEAATEKSTGK